MTLGEKQRKFSKMLAQLILWAYDSGYEITFGEVYRTPEQAALNAKKGTGIANSLHTKCLAADLNLFKDGMYLTKTEDHAALGAQWESMGGTWGGRFPKPDGNHYEYSK
jgi:uncharacterized protein YcbK (DUF882 family)